MDSIKNTKDSIKRNVDLYPNVRDMTAPMI